MTISINLKLIWRMPKAYTSAEIIDKYVCGEYTQYIHRGAFRYAFPPDRSITAVRFYKNGRILDYTNILDTYSFIGTPIGTSVYGDDNKNLRFFQMTGNI
ncbi:MAG: hypothetical protein L6V93_12415 [Clostridiales bacterium]|nr:MAG: hypothetical protein L6V93_12415 [Clostridiales bacterium]